MDDNECNRHKYLVSEFVQRIYRPYVRAAIYVFHQRRSQLIVDALTLNCAESSSNNVNSIPGLPEVYEYFETTQTSYREQKLIFISYCNQTSAITNRVCDDYDAVFDTQEIERRVNNAGNRIDDDQYECLVDM